jgi:predicted phosphodiesterase
MLLIVRVAVLADIHGNLAALEAALEAVERLHPDRLVVAGDVVDGAPDSIPCWERVLALGCPVLRGNHERYVFDYGTERADPVWSTERFGPLRTTLDEIPPARRGELEALPLCWQDAHAPGMLVVHASLRSDADSVLPYTEDDEMEVMFPPAMLPPLVLRGHNHLCQTQRFCDTLIVTAGSIGLPLDSNPSAQFAVAELGSDGWRVRHHAVRYDVDATLRRFEQTDYVDRAGPMGRLLVREVATASPHFVPFLRFWSRRRGESLERAVSSFLGF